MGKSRLARKFIVTLIPLVLIGFLLSAGTGLKLSLDALRVVDDRNLQTSSVLTASRIDDWLSNLDRQVAGIAEMPLLVAALTDHSNSAQANAYFLAVKQLNGYRNIGLLDSDGIAVATSNTDRLGVSYQAKPYFSRVLTSQQPYISEPVRSRVDGQPLLTIAYPVVNHGKVLGVLFASLTLADLYRDYVDISALDPDSFAYVLTNSCEVLAHQNSELILNTNMEYGAQQEFCHNTKARFQFEHQGDQYNATTHVIGKTGWIVVSAINEQVLKSHSQYLVWVNGVLILLVASAVVAGLYFCVARVTSGLLIAEQALKDLCEGDVELNNTDAEDFSKLCKQTDELGDSGRAIANLINAQKQFALNANDVASGNLVTHIPILGERDLLGKALRNMQTGLKNLLQMVQRSSGGVADVTQEIQDQSDQLAMGAREQSLAISSISAALHEIETQVVFTADTSEQISSQAQQAIALAQVGKNQMHDLSQTIESLNEAGKSVAQLTQDITRIAEQTNLIALNAAIESARAGEHGRGFAVVAGEVRELAQLSSKAAEEVTEKVNITLSSMAQGTSYAMQTERSFKEIASHIQSSADRLAELASGSSEQAAALHELTEGLASIESLARQDEEISGRSAQLGNTLSDMSGSLNQAAAAFKIERGVVA